MKSRDSEASVVAAGEWRERPVRFRRDRLIVGFERKADVDAVLRGITDRIQTELSIRSVETRLRPHRGWAVVEFEPIPGAETRIPEVALAISQQRGVRYAHPDFVGRGHLSPNDTKYVAGDQSWVDAIGLPGAWDVTTGSTDVMIAILDSGISMSTGALDHDDLDAARIVVGLSYVSGATIADDHVDGHGTHVTGIAAADSNSGAGVVGVNWTSPVYICRVINKVDNVDMSELSTALEELVTIAEGIPKQCVVVNLSLGDYDIDPLEETALLDAVKLTAGSTSKFLLCCAAGSVFEPDDAIDLPAAYAATFSHVLAVGGLMDADSIDAPSLSAAPPTDPYRSISIFAYGVDILSTLPHDAYGLLTGSSMAAPMVAGVASLVWSVNGGRSAEQVRDLLLDTADKFSYGGFTYRRLNARTAVAAAQWLVQLESSTLQFVDVEPGAGDTEFVRFAVDSVTNLTFRVATETLGAGFAVTNDTANYASGSTTNPISVGYTGGAPGDVAFGSIDILCEESEQKWTVYLSANTAAEERTAIALVADRSGSMSGESGVGGMSRMDILKESASILIDTLRVGDALCVVGFDTDASVVAGNTDIVGEATTSAERVSLKNAVNALEPDGSTSIGDGVALGNTTVAAASQERHAIIVLTDGHENADAFIVEVMGDVTAPVYAIGMGTASVLQPDALATLTDATDGQLSLTGTMNDDERYAIAKYFLQILATASGGGVLVDPHGMIRPGEVAEIPFQVARVDRSFDVTVMVENLESVHVGLRAPDGTAIEPQSLPPGASFRAGDRARHFHVSLPLAVGAKKYHAGSWRAVVSMPGTDRDAFVSDWRLRGAPGRSLGIPYAAIVTGRSDMQMACRVSQDGFRPGARVVLAARVTDRRQPMRWETRVLVDVRSPNGAMQTIELRPTSPGVFEAALTATQAGHHTCRFRAMGRTQVGDPFTREQLLTAHVWHPVPVAADRMRAWEADHRNH